MDYQPIENYAIVGNLKTIALVGMHGSIDFMCYPAFDSPSIFASMLDKNKGGYFRIYPDAEDTRHKQFYLPDTNVLLTRFLSSGGVGEITDFMPVEEHDQGNRLVRRVTSIRGDLTFTLECCPRFNYAQHQGNVRQLSAREIEFRGEGDHPAGFRLVSTVPLSLKENDGMATFTLKASETADFLIEQPADTPIIPAHLKAYVNQAFHATVSYWRNWSNQTNYDGYWKEVVNRSSLVLKLLTSRQYGSMVAAPTFSLPENLGGERNWDYRYTWIRDASFSMYSLINLGYKEEADQFIKWVEKVCHGIGDSMDFSLMYKLDGGTELEEKELTYLEGYKNSRPVRIGNKAYKQRQLDIYGELLDAVYMYNKFCEPISHLLWQDITKLINWLNDHWTEKDKGIWEVRSSSKHFLYSRLMCWVAFDRAVKLAGIRSFPMPGKWVKTRDKIFHSIYEKFWNEDLQTFVQYEGADSVDASILLMPLMRIISAKDPKWRTTLDFIEKKLVTDSLVYRYRHGQAANDGLSGGEGTFSMCTFWLIECLSRSGQVEKARLYFEKMLGFANHVGLYAEQLGFQGEHLGNFPQAFTHLGLISAAFHLDRTLRGKKTVTKG